MHRFIKSIHLATYLAIGIILTTSAPGLAQCEARERLPSSGRTEIRLEPLEVGLVYLVIEEPGLVALEVVAPMAAAGTLWLEVAPRGCDRASGIIFRSLSRSASRQVLLVEEPGELAIRLAFSPRQDAEVGTIDLVRYFLPTNGTNRVGLAWKDGEGDGDGGDGGGSEEADREIPPAPLPIGDGPWPSTLRAAVRWCTDTTGHRVDDSPFCAFHLGNEGAATGTLDPESGDVRDHFAITLAESARVGITIVADDALGLLVTDEDGHIWRAQALPPVRGELVAHLLLPAGRYNLRIEAMSLATTTYQIAVEQVPIR